jgi:Ca2+-binding RTX toxin-like protein
VLFGGSGDDVVAFAAAGDDRLDGGPGNDTIQGGQGNDLRGSDGNWVIRMKMEDLGSKRDF